MQRVTVWDKVMTTYYRIKSKEEEKYLKCTNTSYIMTGYEKSLVIKEKEVAEKLCKELNEEGTHGYLFVEPDTRPPLKDATDNRLLVAAIEHDNGLLVAAIEHAREVANRCDDECGADHANLARWLELGDAYLKALAFHFKNCMKSKPR